MERSDVHRSLAKKAQCHSRLIQVFGRKGNAGSQRNLSAYDAVPAQETQGGVEEVHRSTFALRTPCALAEKFRHNRAGIHSAGQGVAVLAIRAKYGVFRFQRCNSPDCYGFLTDIK